MTILLASPGVVDGGFPHGVTVVRLRAGTAVDPYSDQAADDWSAPYTDNLTGVAIAPTSSDDATGQNGTWVESTLALWSRVPDLDVQPQDRIAYLGTVYTVTGEGGRWARHPMTGRPGGAVFGLKALT